MQTLTNEDLKQIIARRDPRFDGRFYFGVKTTGIYCRPVCPARPKPENIIIFKSASAAEADGFRPCLRCKPDASPGSKVLDGTWNTVSRALRLIDEGTDDELNIESLAATLGVTARHLRRLFGDHLGASPIEIMITRRLHFAKKMILETRLPIAEIAFASGFQSIRRFNEAFKLRFKKSPTAYRDEKTSRMANDVRISIPVHSPYDWQTVLAYLKRHETFGVERIDGDQYQRFVPTRDGQYGSFTVARARNKDHLEVVLKDIPLGALRVTLTRLKLLFDTDHNPIHIPRTKHLAAKGIRVPASFDPFETAVSIILSQLVSTENAKNRLKKLIERFGIRLSKPDELPVYEFPAPTILADAPLEALGLTKTMAGAIRALAVEVRDCHIDFRAPEEFQIATQKLLKLKGVGPWTAAMIAMRCFGNSDAFPATDLIVQRALERKIITETDWLSLRSYLTHCLWRDYSETLSKKKNGKTS